MTHNISFHPTIAGSLKSNIEVDLWENVQNQFHQGDYINSIRNCINYINPAIEKKYANADRTEYNVPHGSVIVHLKITDEALYISAPFLDITTAKQIPVLRQVAQLNFAPLMLSRIDLENNKLYFRFSCALDVCEPLKVYDVLREICINADNYDDEFITKFNATRIQEPKITHYSQDEKDIVWNHIQLYIQEAFDIYDQLENKRLNTYLWDILVITLLKIDYYCAPQGNLRNEIEKAITNLNSKADYYQRLSGGIEFLKKIQNYDKTKLETDLYKIETFVPFKFKTTLESLRKNFKKAYETAENEIKIKDYIGATFTLQYAIFHFLYNNNIDDNITLIITNALQQATNKPVNEASKILYNMLHVLMTTDDISATIAPHEPIKENKNIEKKGFFSKLFG